MTKSLPDGGLVGLLKSFVFWQANFNKSKRCPLTDYFVTACLLIVHVQK